MREGNTQEKEREEGKADIYLPIYLQITCLQRLTFYQCWFREGGAPSVGRRGTLSVG